MEKKQRGRPPFPSWKTRSKRVVTFVTEAELEKIQRLASGKDIAVSTAVYQILSKELES